MTNSPIQGKSPVQILPSLLCRKCGKVSPWVYYAPITENNTCICLNCAEERGWVDEFGKLRDGVTL